MITAFSADRTVSPSRGFLLKPVVAAAVPQKRDLQTYTVVDGDTLSGIADQFGITVDTLRWANNLQDVDTLSLGQQVVVPPVNGVLVTVKDGDTVSSLSAKYTVPAQTIIDFNLIRTPDHLTAGTRVMVPSGAGEAAPVTSSPTTRAEHHLQRLAWTRVPRDRAEPLPLGPVHLVRGIPSLRAMERRRP